MNKLFVIAGHGAGDNGAAKNGFKEAERVRALAQKIKDFGGAKVMLCDFNINAYKSDFISKGLIPKDSLVLELHLDSSVLKSPKGGHVIIKSKFEPDEYDVALAKMISEMFPGRDESIVKRGDLANVNRAASKGYNYRLLECCFISNEDDIKKFNANIDTLAKNILSCFGIAVEVQKKKTVEELAKEVIKGLHGIGHENRKASLAKQGYNNYEEVRQKVNELQGASTTTQKASYFAKYNGKSGSLVTALSSLKINSTFDYRKKIAVANGISDYKGTASQNIRLLSLLKAGKLIKP